MHLHANNICVFIQNGNDMENAFSLHTTPDSRLCSTDVKKWFDEKHEHSTLYQVKPSTKICLEKKMVRKLECKSFFSTPKRAITKNSTAMREYTASNRKTWLMCTAICYLATTGSFFQTRYGRKKLIV